MHDDLVSLATTLAAGIGSRERSLSHRDQGLGVARPVSARARSRGTACTVCFGQGWSRGAALFLPRRLLQRVAGLLERAQEERPLLGSEATGEDERAVVLPVPPAWAAAWSAFASALVTRW
jgi:hypothetical protein